MSQEGVAVAAPNGGVAVAAPNNGGVLFQQFLENEHHDAHVRRYESRSKWVYLCTVINNDGNVCTKQKVYWEDGQHFCRSHFKSYSLFQNGIPTQYGDSDIYGNIKTTAKDYYDKLIDTYYKKILDTCRVQEWSTDRGNCNSD